MSTEAILNLRTIGVERARRSVGRANRQADLNAAFKPHIDEAGPTPERAARSTFDTPEIDSKTNRRAYRARDLWDEMLRREEIEMPEYRAAERWEHHYLGMMRHDVRVTDTTGSRVDDDRRSGWDKHVHALDEARSALMPSEFRALELITMGHHDLKLIGVELSRYRNADTARAYALRVVQGGLERLSRLWGYRETRPPLR